MIPMVEEVDKIIYNQLVSCHALHIPTVGSLLVERVAARRISKQHIMPPYYAVIFTSHTVGESLVAAIANVAQCDHAVAEVLFGRWLERAKQGDVVTIGGVGVLRQKSFAIDAAFDRAVNRHDRSAIPVRGGHSNWIFWTAASIAIVCGLGACGWVFYDRSVEDRRFDPANHSSSKIVEVVEQPAVVADSVADSVAVVSSETTMPEVAVIPATPLQPAISLEVQATTPGRNYVVLGVFSTVENAQRAAREAMEANPALRCGVWNFGSKFMTSLYASDDSEECAIFIGVHKESYPEVWSHKAR